MFGTKKEQNNKPPTNAANEKLNQNQPQILINNTRNRGSVSQTGSNHLSHSINALYSIQNLTQHIQNLISQLNHCVINYSNILNSGNNNLESFKNQHPHFNPSSTNISQNPYHLNQNIAASQQQPNAANMNPNLQMNQTLDHTHIVAYPNTFFKDYVLETIKSFEYF